MMIRSVSRASFRLRTLGRRFAASCALDETDKLLRIAEYDALYVRRPRDGIIMHCLDNGVSITDANLMLSEKEQEPIGKF